MMKKAALDHLIATTNKEQSVAELNNSKSGATQATAIYDIAMAKNMMHDNARQEMQNQIAAEKASTDKITAIAQSHKAIADADKSRAQAENERGKGTSEREKVAMEALRARTEALMASRQHQRDDALAAHQMDMERRGHALETMNAHAGMITARGGYERDLAAAFKARKDAVRPTPKPAARK